MVMLDNPRREVLVVWVKGAVPYLSVALHSLEPLGLAKWAPHGKKRSFLSEGRDSVAINESNCVRRSCNAIYL